MGNSQADFQPSHSLTLTFLTSMLLGQRHLERLNVPQAPGSTAFRHLCMSIFLQAAKAWTPAQSGAVQLTLPIWKTSLFVLVLLALTAWPARGSCEDGPLTRIGSQTLGGPTSWTDEVIHGGWRIQRHETFGHYRLLDARERRVTFGTMEDCFAELNCRRLSGQIAPMPEHVVITIHGLAGSRGIMEGLGAHLKEHGGFSVINFGYASTSGPIQKQAVALESVLRNLDGVREVSFVGHSMGCIVVRHLLFKLELQGNPPPISFRRMVMISPPNHGAEIADTVGQARLFQIVLGDVVDQFAPTKGWPLLEQQLAIPAFEFGIIAGGRGTEGGYMPRVAGDDDGLLSLQTHMLAGAHDFVQTGGLHQIMPRYKSVREETCKFLQTGHF